MSKPMYHDVAPRYTCGSPGLVDQTTAERFAKEELTAYERCLEGVYGDEDQAKAKLMGLRGIVQKKVEKGSGKTHRYEVTDLCTGERYDMPMGTVLQKLGYHPYKELSESARKAIDEDPPKQMGDYRRTGWFKTIRFDRFEVYVPQMKREP